MTNADADTDAGLFFEDINVGDSDSISRQVTEQDIVGFAQVTGDTNPVHLDADYAATTLFGQRVAHGMLSAGYISAVFGTKLPGPGAIYVNQSLKFRAPVMIGDTVTASVTATEKVDRKAMIVFETLCRVGDKVVMEGEATLMVPRRPAQ